MKLAGDLKDKVEKTEDGIENQPFIRFFIRLLLVSSSFLLNCPSI